MNRAGSRGDEERIDRPSDVEYLVFGGGGARAIGHLGALAALADLGYLKRVVREPTSPYQPREDFYLRQQYTTAVAGSSTGGLIAALLALGVGIRTIFHILVPGGRGQLDFVDRVLAHEEMKTRYRPTFEGMEKVTLDDPHADFWSEDGAPPGLLGEAKNVRGSVKTEGLDLAGQALGELLTQANDSLGLEIPPVLIDRLLSDGRLTTYARNVLVDYGAFSGRNLRWSFGHPDSSLHDVGIGGHSSVNVGRLIQREANSGAGPGDDDTPSVPVNHLGNLSFGQYADFVDASHRRGGAELRTHLALTATNVSTRESHVLSAEATPNVPIADAVRTTMAFPLLLKPTFVDGGDNAGVWADGSIMNAYPLHAFDRDGVLPDHVLGFQLGLPDQYSIDTFSSLVRAVGARFLEVSSSGQVRTGRDRAHTVTLPVGDTPYFSVPEDWSRLRPVLERSAEAVYGYFGARSPEGRASNAVRILYAPRSAFESLPGR